MSGDLKSRAKRIAVRQFKRDIDMYIIDTIIKKPEGGMSPIGFQDWIKKLDKSIIDQYVRVMQLSENEDDVCIGNQRMKISEIDDEYEKISIPGTKSDYYHEHYNELEKKIETYFGQLVENGKSNGANQCHYCGISESIIEDVLKSSEANTSSSRRFLTKRFFYNRGRSLEIDQVDPNIGYRAENIVLTCYWCNNAKTDEFTYHEFKYLIAPQIRHVWELRFGKTLPPVPPALR